MHILVWCRYFMQQSVLDLIVTSSQTVLVLVHLEACNFGMVWRRSAEKCHVICWDLDKCVSVSSPLLCRINYS